MSAAIDDRVATRDALHTIFKVSAELGNDFSGGKFTVHEVSYPEESDMPRSDMRGPTGGVTAFITLPRDLKIHKELTLGFKVQEPGQQRVSKMQSAILLV